MANPRPVQVVVEKAANALTSAQVDAFYKSYVAGAAFGVIELAFNYFIKELNSKGLIIAASVGPEITLGIFFIGLLTNALKFKKTQTVIVPTEDDMKIITRELVRVEQALQNQGEIAALDANAQEKLLEAILHVANNNPHANRLLQLNAILTELGLNIIILGAASFAYFLTPAFLNKDLDSKTLKGFAYGVTIASVVFATLYTLAHAFKDDKAIYNLKTETIAKAHGLREAVQRLSEDDRQRIYGDRIRAAFTLLADNRPAARIEAPEPAPAPGLN